MVSIISYIWILVELELGKLPHRSILSNIINKLISLLTVRN